MNIVNENRKRQSNSFIDKDHEVMDAFYEIIDNDLHYKKILSEMHKLIKIDPDFCDPYLTARDILFSMGKEEEAELLLREAYRRALLTIVDSKGRWPKEMLWGYLKNRHIMRAIHYQGWFYWETGKVDEALDIFRKLLRANPSDNQGMRHNILAIRMNLGIDEWQKPFEVERDGEIAGLDAFKVNDWFRKNAPKYKDEFQWLFDVYKSRDEELQ